MQVFEADDSEVLRRLQRFWMLIAEHSVKTHLRSCSVGIWRLENLGQDHECWGEVCKAFVAGVRAGEVITQLESQKEARMKQDESGQLIAEKIEPADIAVTSIAEISTEIDKANTYFYNKNSPFNLYWTPPRGHDLRTPLTYFLVWGDRHEGCTSICTTWGLKHS